MTHRLRTSQTGLELIKSLEGFRARAVQLPDGRWSIGHGHTKTARANLRITPADAEVVLQEYDLPPIERVVSSAVLAPLSQNEFDALVSFAFNIGEEAFLGSNTLGHLNTGQPLAAAHAMSSWRKARVNGRLIVVDALVRRRVMEQALFLKHPSGTVSAPSGFMQPISEAAGEGIKRTRRPIPNRPPVTQTRPKATKSEARVILDAERLTGELSKAVEPPIKTIAEPETKLAPEHNTVPGASDLPPGPTPDEITRAISALVNPDGNEAETIDVALPIAPVVEAEKNATIDEGLSSSGSDDGVGELPPLPGFDYDDDLDTDSDADEETLLVRIPDSEVIDDLAPVEIDPELIKKAEDEARGLQGKDALLSNPRRVIHGLTGGLGLVFAAWGIAGLQRAQQPTGPRGEGLEAYFSIGGIVLGGFLILLALYLAFRSAPTKA